MNFPPPPARDDYEVKLINGKQVAVIPLSWMKWFSLLFKIFTEIYTEYQRIHTVDSVSTSTTLDDDNGTVIVSADGQTITLPAASTARIGKDWTIIFATTGTCTVACAGSDTFPAVTSANETTLTMTGRGDSVTFQCTSASTWGVV